MKLNRYKSIRNKPKKISTLSRSKRQLRTKPISNSLTAPKLREIYSTNVGWTTKVIPERKEKEPVEK